MNNRLATFTFTLITILAIGYLLITARTLLIPVIIAIFLWYLLNTIAQGMKKIPAIGGHLPNGLCLSLALVILLYLVYLLVIIITNNVNEVINSAPRYQNNLMAFLQQIDARFNIKILAMMNDWVSQLNFRATFLNIYGVFTTITSNALLISLYVIFLFLEQQVMRAKLEALFNQKKHLQLADTIISQILKDTETYVGIKTFLSLITAGGSWVLMKSVGLDFSEFWAILIFFLNFIPNIGAVIATVFPAALAIIQFNTSWWPFMVITGGITLIQFIVGNFIEPKLMGDRLNLSPLVILITLAIWGALWGILGMFLSVPITVIMMIIFSHFRQTESIAILLSKNGKIGNE